MTFITATQCESIAGGRSDGPAHVVLPYDHFPTPTSPVFRPPPES